MSKRDRCKCVHCKEVFQSDRHNWWHQKFCTKPQCRQASKAQSQRAWLKRPENRDVFRGWANVHRVRQWRDKHPGYWKRGAKEAKDSSPEPVAVRGLKTVTCDGKTSCNVPPPPLPSAAAPLQDFVLKQNPLLVGLIAHLITHRYKRTWSKPPGVCYRKAKAFWA